MRSSPPPLFFLPHLNKIYFSLCITKRNRKGENSICFYNMSSGVSPSKTNHLLTLEVRVRRIGQKLLKGRLGVNVIVKCLKLVVILQQILLQIKGNPNNSENSEVTGQNLRGERFLEKFIRKQVKTGIPLWIPCHQEVSQGDQSGQGKPR